MKTGQKVLCLDPQGAKGFLQTNAIYTVDKVEQHLISLVEVKGAASGGLFFSTKRFKLVETPSIESPPTSKYLGDTLETIKDSVRRNIPPSDTDV